MAAQVLDTAKSPMWCAMKLARGLNTASGPAALGHQAQLVGSDGLAQFVVADSSESAALGMTLRVFDTGNLLVAPVFERFGGGGVVSVAVDDHGGLSI
jgi:hypothetical protein